MEELLKLAERMIEAAENGQVGSNGWEYDLAVFRERYKALSMSGVSGELFCFCGKPSKMPLCFDCFKGHLDEIDPQNNYH